MQEEFKPVDFENLEIAFAGRSDRELKRAYWLFKSIGMTSLVKMAPRMVDLAFALRLPVTPIIKATIFRHFCGGETIAECNETIQSLWSRGIGSILDYSVEGAENESNFDYTTQEIIATIERAKGDPSVPFSVFKVTGISPFGLLEKEIGRAHV